MNPNPTGKKKARRITYIMSVVFGFIGMFIIIKGFRDMYRKIDTFVYFDRIMEAKRDTLVSDAAGNTYQLIPPTTLKYSTRHPQMLVLDGKAAFDVKQPVRLLTPDTIVIRQGKGIIESGRFPEIWLTEGELIINGQRLEGKNLHWSQGKIIKDLPQHLQE